MIESEHSTSANGIFSSPVRRVNYFDSRGALSVVMSSSADRNMPTIHASGVKIFAHNPKELTGDASVSVSVTPNTEMNLRVITTLSYCSDGVVVLSPEDRDCIHDHERQLRYFNEYYEPNCLVECRIEKFLEFCGCAPYYFSAINNQSRNTFPICGFEKIKCLVDNICKPENTN